MTTDSQELFSQQAIAILSRMAGIDISPDDGAQVADALRQQLAALEAIDRFDLSDVDPILQLDLNW